jgi:hypothetical protein
MVRHLNLDMLLELDPYRLIQNNLPRSPEQATNTLYIDSFSIWNHLLEELDGQVGNINVTKHIGEHINLSTDKHSPDYYHSTTEHNVGMADLSGKVV